MWFAECCSSRIHIYDAQVIKRKVIDAFIEVSFLALTYYPLHYTLRATKHCD